jgi:phenylacetate-CoA ligase
LADNDRGLDWIVDRDAECSSPGDQHSVASAAWRQQREYVFARSGFYRRKLGDGMDVTGIELADLRELPLTTKQELQAAQQEQPPYGDHLAAEPDDVKRVYRTSGTSGTPTTIALTRSDIAVWATVGTRSYYATGVRPHNSVLSTFGAGPFVVGNTHDVVEELGARLVPVGPRNTGLVMSTLRAGLADTLLTTPSFALHLIDRLAAEGVDPSGLGLAHLITGGEPGGGLDSIRRGLESVFEATVTEAMGLGDIAPSLFGECPAQQGMHFCGQGLVWPELIDTDGEPVPIEAGAEGELAYTHLQREAMPLIRFRSGDRVRITTTGCPCGRTSFAMRIAGRVDDMFIVRGVNVYPSAVQDVVAEHLPAVTGRIRITVPPPGLPVQPPVPIKVEVSDGVSTPAGLADRVAETIRSRLRFRAAVELVPQQIFGSADYKTRAVVRDGTTE